ncbi:MAG: MMPL family transporter [Oscillospiraceae bacterium]|jgi:predicted RND superfamily exporter protein|nr:MMPL family transporter [Oscillospiraceae bacterium]
MKPIYSMLKHKRLIILFFVVLCLAGALLIPLTGINYQLADYLPDDAPSTVAIDVMSAEFAAAMPNLRLMLRGVTIAEALEAKALLQKEPYVQEILWLDDTVNVKEPLELAAPAAVEAWYKDGDALFMLTCDNSAFTDQEIYDSIKGIFGDKAYMAGDITEHIAAQASVSGEVSKIMAFIIPAILIILLLTTNSWFSPVLFGIVIISGILLNLGTNFIFGEISFLTQSIAPVLQLAVSMDYSIFLLSAFDKYKEEGLDSVDAMAHAVKETASTVIASGATTFIGFLVLGFMRFKIGPDLGFTLAKGIIFSMLSALLLLPCATLACRGILLKLKHRPLIPKFTKFAKVTAPSRIPVLVLVLLLIVPAYLGQQNNSFIYGAGGVAQGSEIGDQEALVKERFGEMSQMVLLIPGGYYGEEAAIVEELKTLDGVTGVVGYITSVGNAVPQEIVPEDALAQLQSENYRRLIMSVDVGTEGDRAFNLVAAVRTAADAYFPGEYHLIGGAVSTYDMKEVVQSDNLIVNGLCIAAIFVTLLLTFRSLSLPFILLLTIEAAVWINLAVPYFQGEPLHFIAYMIVSTVQLGSTIDYAILFTENYRANRKSNNPKASALKTLASTTPSILVPVIILALAGVVLSILSSNFIVSAFGIVLARGALLSAVLTLFFLPGLLVLCDKLVLKTTLRGKKDAT